MRGRWSVRYVRSLNKIRIDIMVLETEGLKVEILAG